MKHPRNEVMHFPRSFKVSWQQCASSEASFRTFWSVYSHAINPANPQRPNNVVTLLRRCVFAGKISLQAINECCTVWYDSTFSDFGIMVKYQLKIRCSQQINNVVQCRSDVTTTSKRRYYDVLCLLGPANLVETSSFWRRSDVQTTLLRRFMFTDNK